MGRREKPLDPGEGPVQRFALELRKLRDETGGLTYRAMARRAGYSAPTLAAAAGGVRLPSLAVLTAYVTACGGEPEEWTRRLREALAETRAPAGPDEEGSPYPGLARFGTGDGDHFHGRDDLIGELLRRTARARFTAVVGASGSGKSSLLRAGLVPALRTADDLKPAAIRLLTPGPHPARTHEPLFTPYDAPGDTLLVVDQFEELFTLCADPAERDRFLARLLTATDPASRLRVVIAVRADFYGRCAEHGPLAEALRDAALLVGPMSPGGLREAVVRPAAARRLVVERALTARIVADVAGEPGGLPLMAHALREVWRRRTGKALTLAAYEAIGGVHGAVAHTAEAAYATCTPAEAIAARGLLLRLVQPGDGTEDTRRPVPRTELDADTTTTRVLERLVRERLLTVDGDTVELAHEALIRAWPRLRGWIEENRERLRVHRRLTEAAHAWAELDREADALYRGIRLTEAREAFRDGGGGTGLSRLERDFLAASAEAHQAARRAATRAARRLRTLAGALAVLLCLAVVAGAAAWRQSEVSSRQRDEAEARRAAALADTLRATEPRTAMRLALAAWRTADLPETRTALRSAAAQSEEAAFVQPEEGGRALNAPAWLSRDGRILTTVLRDRAVQWDVPRQRRLRSVARKGLSAGVVDVSPDGRFLARRPSGDRDGVVIVGLADGRGRRLPTGAWTDTDMAFGPSGRTILVRRLDRASGGGRATLEVWDPRRQRKLLHYADGEDDGPLPVLSGDDRHLAWCGQDGTRLRILDVARGTPVPTGAPRATQRALCQGESLTFTPDGRAVAGGTADGIVTWDFRTRRERPRLPLSQGALSVEFAGAHALAWGPGALTLWRPDLPAPADDSPPAPLLTVPVASSAIGDVRLDLAAGVLRYRETGRTSVVRTVSLHGLADRAWTDRRAPGREPPRVGGVEAVAVDPARRTALTSEGTLVDATDGSPLAAAGGVTGEDLLRTAAFSPDGRFLAAEDTVGRLTLWDARAWRRLAVLRPGASTLDRAALAFSADGSLLAASALDGSVRVWETATPSLPAATVPVGDGPVLNLAFGSGVLRVLTAHLPVRTSPLAPERAAAQVCERAEGGATEAEWRRFLPSVPYRKTCEDA
ncbi:nSTAND1 domain-containing NTPase [Streptomyces sp. NPDC003635]